MDIIEIDSSESDDDIEIGWGSTNRQSNNDTSTSKVWNGASSVDLSDMNRSNFPYASQLNEDDEIISWINNGLNTACAQKRTIPSSFQPFTSKASLNKSRFQEAPRPLMPSNSYDDDLHIIDFSENKEVNKIPQHMPQMLLPPLPQAARMHNGSFECDNSSVNNFSTSSMDDDVYIYKTVGKQRVLSPSTMNGKSVYNAQVNSSYDIVDRVDVAEKRCGEHNETSIYQEALQNLTQPNIEDDLPNGLLSVSLLKHQKIALAWMVNKEKKSINCAGGILADDQGLGKTISMIALIQKQMNQQTKFTSNNLQQIKPEALNLEGDDILIDLDKEKPHLKINQKKVQISSTSILHPSGCSRPAAGTLVVCPASILRQWASELDQKVSNDAKLSILVYHGSTRTRDPAELAKYDVVITTYAIIANEVPKQNADVNDDDKEQKNLDTCELIPDFSSKKRKEVMNGRGKENTKSKKNNVSHLDSNSGPLARVRWFRVILDEAQIIKNHRTQVARACSGLRAKRRWCLSGTPIQNSIDDLYSYFRFLKYDPYAVYSSFCTAIKNPILRNSKQGYMKLQAVLRVVLLRRTKDTKIGGEPIINLPSKSVILKRADFSSEERSFYMKLEGDSRQQFKKYAAAGTLNQNYASILLMLLRLRQACDHPVLVKGYQNSDTVGKKSLETAKQLPLGIQYNLLQKLEGFVICAVCNDPPEEAVVTMCGHVFCYQCLSERLTGESNFCPAFMCGKLLSRSSVFSRTTLLSSISGGIDNDNMASSSGMSTYDDFSVVQKSYVSSKIKAAVEILNSFSNPLYNVETNECDGIRPNTAPVKTIIFSQWTSMLDLLELSLNQSLIQYRRLDGSMPLPKRDKAVKDFNMDPEVTVMIMSLKAGNLGLNMVAACHVILLDLWWNPTTEDQAVDRAHRIGQTRPVTVSRLTIKDTVEDRILALQEEKRKMVSAAFGEDQAGGHASKLTVEDLRYLFMA